MLPTLKTIVYATDLGDRAVEVFRYAMSLAQQYDAKIVVVHAVEPLSPYAKSVVSGYLPPEDREGIPADARERVLGAIRERLERFCADEVCTTPDGGARVVESLVLEGHPAEVILKEVRRTGADLVVMGAHGHTLVGEMLLGSVAHRVVQRSPVPVLLVRLPE